MKKTDNSHLQLKIELRERVLEMIPDGPVRVLECFSGKSVLWRRIRKLHPDRDIRLLSIEKERGKNAMALCGDCMKVLPSLDLSNFDIIDVDAYGVPCDVLDFIAGSGWHGYVIVTSIIIMQGSIPDRMLSEVGINKEMRRQTAVIWRPFYVEILKNFLYLRGVQDVEGVLSDKSYFYFKL